MKVLSSESQRIAAGVLALPCAARPLEALRRVLFGRRAPSTAAADEWALAPEDRALLADTSAGDRLAVAIADARVLLAELKGEKEIRGQKAA